MIHILRNKDETRCNKKNEESDSIIIAFPLIFEEGKTVFDNKNKTQPMLEYIANVECKECLENLSKTFAHARHCCDEISKAAFKRFAEICREHPGMDIG